MAFGNLAFDGVGVLDDVGSDQEERGRVLLGLEVVEQLGSVDRRAVVECESPSVGGAAGSDVVGSTSVASPVAPAERKGRKDRKYMVLVRLELVRLILGPCCTNKADRHALQSTKNKIIGIGTNLLVSDWGVRAGWRVARVEWDGGGASQIDFLEPCLDFGRGDRGDLVDGWVSGKRRCLCRDQGHRQGQDCDGGCEKLDHCWLCDYVCCVCGSAVRKEGIGCTIGIV